MMTINSPHGDGDNAHDDDDDGHHGDGDKADDDDDNGHLGDGDTADDDDDDGHLGHGGNADDDDEPPQTNLPPIIADSRDPGGEVRLKV